MKKVSIFIIVTLIITIFTACSSNTNSIISNLKLEKTDDSKAMAYIINHPTEEQLKKVPNLETYEHENSNKEESFLFVPISNKSTIKVFQLSFENNKLQEEKMLYQTDDSKDYALYVKTFRPEGIPFLKITIENEGSVGEYIVSYNGKDGIPDIEIVNKTQ